MPDWPQPQADPEPETGRRGTIDTSEAILPWWRRSRRLAACAAVAIGLATWWFANMLGRVPLDAHSTLGYLLMMPLLLIVPAFSLAGLRLSWLALGSPGHWRQVIAAAALLAIAANGWAIVRFLAALWRIFSY